MQPELEPGQRSEHADHGSSDSIPLEVVEEPARPPNDTELIQDDGDEKDDENDDGDESARFLLDVVRRQAVDRDPVQRDLHVGGKARVRDSHRQETGNKTRIHEDADPEPGEVPDRALEDVTRVFKSRSDPAPCVSPKGRSDKQNRREPFESDFQIG